jgi:type II secretory pathway predicted ATPase ExeA
MYRAFYGMTCNPFHKDKQVSQLYRSKDVADFLACMEYFKQVKGVGVLFGRPGMGKTTALRAFTADLNSQLYYVLYQPLSTVSVKEFYQGLCHGLGLTPAYKKVEMFRQIQEHIQTLCHQKKQTPLFILDEAQFISQDILNELRMLMNFHMDSKDYAMLLLCGQSHFISQLNLHGNEPLRQRILVHYEFTGLTDQEIPEYLRAMLKHASVEDPVFKPEAVKALIELCGGSPRVLDHLVDKALLLGFQHKQREIDAELIQKARQAVAIYATAGGASA